MRQFIAVQSFVYWFFKHCEEPFPYTSFQEDFEGCLWMPLDYLTDLLTPTAITDLTDRVKVLDEIEIEITQQH
jgi:hypothetical protein